MARKIMLLTAIASLSTLFACNTVKGLGRDIESVGKKGEKVIKGQDQ